MENEYFQELNGQELRSQDVESISHNAALADDRVIWELIRLLPGSATPDKAIIPFARRDGASPADLPVTAALVQGNNADGKVRVLPFRAIIGPTATDDSVEELRGQRSGYLIGTTDYLATELSVTANVSGNPRWDLIYVIVSPDADGDEEELKRKAPGTGVVTDETVTINRKTTVVLSRVQGTPAASPTRPALPVDSGGNYNIPIAYIWIPTGYGASGSIDARYIHEHAPVATITRALGVSTVAPGNSHYTIGGIVDDNQAGETSVFRPDCYLPSTMVGGEERFFLLQLGKSPQSPLNEDIIDDSVDWRRRYFWWIAQCKSGTTTAAGFASANSTTGSFPVPSAVNAAVSPRWGVRVTAGMGQSFIDDSDQGVTFSPAVSDGHGGAVYFSGIQLTDIQSGSADENDAVMIYVNNDGALVFRNEGTTDSQIIVWLRATAPFAAYNPD